MDLLSNIINSFSDYDLIAMEREAKDFALINGIVHRSASLPTDTASLISVSLFPSSFDRKLYDRVKRLQPLLNKLIHEMSFNHHFICQSFEKSIESDEFINRLFQIYNTVVKEGLAQNTRLGFFRSDYLMNECKDGSIDIKQVEMNDIPAGAGILPKVTKLHKHILSKYTDIEDLDHCLPENRSTELSAEGFIKAFDLYNRPNAVILCVEQTLCRFMFEHRFIEFCISQSRSDIKIIRRSFQQLRDKSCLNGNRELIIDNRHEVAVVCYRYGFNPQHFEGERDWETKLMIERSKAIKYPSIQYQLMGSKKIQQIISNQTVLEKLVANETDVKDLMQVFTGQWGLELGSDGDNAIEMALSNPKGFVLKPQREGGGHNYFGDELRAKLNAIKDSKERESYVLMQTISSPKVTNHLLFSNQCLSEHHFQPMSIVSEFGVFGSVIGDQYQIIHNREAGHMMRSKVSGNNETAVIAGLGAYDSPFLY